MIVPVGFRAHILSITGSWFLWLGLVRLVTCVRMHGRNMLKGLAFARFRCQNGYSVALIDLSATLPPCDYFPRQRRHDIVESLIDNKGRPWSAAIVSRVMV